MKLLLTTLWMSILFAHGEVQNNESLSQVMMWEMEQLKPELHNLPQKTAQLPKACSLHTRPAFHLSPLEDYLLVCDVPSGIHRYMSVHLPSMKSYIIDGAYIDYGHGGGYYAAKGLTDNHVNENDVILMSPRGFLVEHDRNDETRGRAFSYTGQALLTATEYANENLQDVDIDKINDKERFLKIDYDKDKEYFLLKDSRDDTQMLVPNRKMRKLAESGSDSDSWIMNDEISKAILYLGPSKVAYLPWFEREPISRDIPIERDNDKCEDFLFFNHCLYIISRHACYVYDFRNNKENMSPLLKDDELSVFLEHERVFTNYHIFPDGKLVIFLAIGDQHSNNSNIYKLFIFEKEKLINSLSIEQKYQGENIKDSLEEFERVQCVDNYLIIPTSIQHNEHIYSFYRMDEHSNKPSFTLKTQKHVYFYQKSIKGKIWAFSRDKSFLRITDSQ